MQYAQSTPLVEYKKYGSLLCTFHKKLKMCQKSLLFNIGYDIIISEQGQSPKTLEILEHGGIENEYF